jgi:hypothetical protein
MKNAIIAALALALVFVSSRLVFVENQRVALITGMCKPDPTNLKWFDCLKTVETRTSWVAHLFYALTE